MYVNTPPLQNPCQTCQVRPPGTLSEGQIQKGYYYTVFIFKHKSGNDEPSFTIAPLSSCLPAPMSHSMCYSAACEGRGAEQSSTSTSSSPPTTILTIAAWTGMQSERLLNCMHNEDYFEVTTILGRQSTSTHSQAFWKLHERK